jgi:hypothetical protein
LIAEPHRCRFDCRAVLYCRTCIRLLNLELSPD